MKSNKAYKFRLYPNAEQQKLIDKIWLFVKKVIYL